MLCPECVARVVNVSTPPPSTSRPREGVPQPSVNFTLHTDCVPERIKAKSPGFWKHMPITRAYIVRHNYRSTDFFSFEDAEAEPPTHSRPPRRPRLYSLDVQGFTEVKTRASLLMVNGFTQNKTNEMKMA